MLNPDTLVMTPDRDPPVKNSMSIQDNPIPWIGAIGTLAMFGITTSFTWALGIQEKLLNQDARLKVIEISYSELRGDIKEIKDNVFFLRVNQPAQSPVTISNSTGRGK